MVIKVTLLQKKVLPLVCLLSHAGKQQNYINTPRHASLSRSHKLISMRLKGFAQIVLYTQASNSNGGWPVDNLAKWNYKQMKSPPVGKAHNELKMKKQTNAKQPSDCNNIGH